MEIWFWDSSALVKRYFDEPGTATVRGWAADASRQHWITRITLAEISSVIVRRIPANDAAQYLAQFDTDVRSFNIGSLDDTLVTEAVALTRLHRLRGCDSLQLAAARRLDNAITQLNESQTDDADVFFIVCTDAELNRAATVCGLVVINPV